MPPLRLVGEQVAELGQSFGDDSGKLDDSGHDAVLHDRFGRPAITLYRQITHENACENQLCKSSVIS
jgi:hypothetical protein